MAIGYGAVSIANLNSEFGGGYSMANYYRNNYGSYVAPHNTNVPTSGPLPLSSFRGAYNTTSGAADYYGSSSIQIPAYRTITFQLWGAGGGGGGSTYDVGYPGSAGGGGGYAYIPGLGMIAYGGGGGAGSYYDYAAAGGAGSGSGGSVYPGSGNPGGVGGTYGFTKGGDGGAGGYVVRTFYYPEISVGAVYGFEIQGGGAGGAGQVNGSYGSGARIYVSWT